ncbi:unnamed protein product [Bemisia tabaci]|uniref:Peptidase C1A papain C-terminal domain-containing protein n=1 Tax=Bemisia tabaci TaxID=7038 RepID=A0A9P0ALC3_BEMTA|nr:unnamed protein product [Bemisia tabaci]
MLKWRNETYHYWMSWPKINRTVTDFYDKINTWLKPISHALINFPLRVIYVLYKTISSIATMVLGSNAVEFVFPQRKGEILSELHYNGSWIQMWYDARLNESWGLPFYLSPSTRLWMAGATLREITELNSREKGSARYGLTHFAPYTKTEFQRKYCTYHSTYDGRAFYSDEETINVGPTPEQFDWKTRGLVSKVKNNENCGGGWAYAVVDCLEMHNAIRRNASVVEYSAQQIVDCDKNSRGCAGGSVTNAYKYIKDAGGLALERSYPYTFRESSCLFEPSMAKIRIKSTFYTLPPSEETIRHFIYNYGPVVAAINCAQLQFYKRGVIRCNDENCNPRHMNHAVVVVGYGVEGSRGANSTSGIPYWLVKNSWGTAWGEEGYFKVFRGKRENTLGIQNFLTAPMVDVDSFEGKGKW